MEERLEKIKALMEDHEFVEELIKMESNEDVQRAFFEKGVVFTIEEVNQMADIMFGDDCELSEDQMDQVAGGFIAEAVIVCSGVSLIAGVMVEVNKSRTSKGKKPIW